MTDLTLKYPACYYWNAEVKSFPTVYDMPIFRFTKFKNWNTQWKAVYALPVDSYGHTALKGLTGTGSVLDTGCNRDMEIMDLQNSSNPVKVSQNGQFSWLILKSWWLFFVDLYEGSSGYMPKKKTIFFYFHLCLTLITRGNFI